MAQDSSDRSGNASIAEAIPQQSVAGYGFTELPRPEASNHSPNAPAGTASPETGARTHDEDPIDSVPAPAFGHTYDQLRLEQDGLGTQANVSHDGRVNIKIDQHSQRLSNLLAPALGNQMSSQAQKPPTSSTSAAYLPPSTLPPSLTGGADQASPPPMNLVIQVVGSRGDVQPFISLGQVLKNKYGHRVRLATHLTFKTFVEENGLEFFNIGGDPAELMAFMVKNPGLVPGLETLRSGDVGRRRKGIYEILLGCWKSCIEAGDGIGKSSHHEHAHDDASVDSAVSLNVDPTARPFIADAIIANPACFAHIHIAEKLGIPLHMMFTMPWSPTQAFPHPLANIQASNADANMSNFISYALVEMLTWQGLGSVVNRFREKTLRLEPVSVMWAPGMLSRLRIPWTYCWSPALIPKPQDWGSHIDIAGFYFLSLASSYKPPPELVAFLEAGPPPVYIGFGSIVIDDPTALTNMIFDAVKKTGIRALVSKGWGGLGTDELGVPEGVYMLGNVPHDWLFNYVSAVVHHGGAGTTAAGVSMGKPTMVVPFFGDQPFWGSMIARAGAGPQPIPYKHLTADNLAASILQCLEPTTKERAAELGAKISKESGADIGAKSFHDKLGVDTLRCTLAPSKVAVWRVRRTQVRLSAMAAAVLGKEGLLDFHELKLYRPREYNSEDGPWDPISGGASALIGTMGSLMMGLADVPVEVIKALAVKNEHPSRGSSRQNSMAPTSGNQIPTLSQQKTELGSSNKASGSGMPVMHEDGSVSLTPDDRRIPEITSPAGTEPRPLATRSDSSFSNGVHADHQKKSMMQKLGNHLTQHHLTNDASPSGSAMPRVHFDCPECRARLQAAAEAGSGVGRVVEAGLRSPMEFTLAMARGFHNAPKLYGDQSVRSPEKVTGIQSGLKVAGKEFGYGFYDGIVGLATQPYEGLKAEGAVGFLKGFAKGLGGFLLKPGAAIWAVPGYTFEGIYRELQKTLGSSNESYIIASRTAQGLEDAKSCTQEERLNIISGWKAMQHDIRKAQQNFAEETRQTVAEYNLKRQQTFEETKKHWKERKLHKEADSKEKHSSQHGHFPSLHHLHSHHGSTTDGSRHEEYEKAIKTSVAATSQGDSEQDEMIERAIRASIAEMTSAHKTQIDDDEALRRALDASISEARADPETGSTLPEDEELKEALKKSLHEHQFSVAQVHETVDSGFGSDDESFNRTLHGYGTGKKQDNAAQARTQNEEEALVKHVEQIRLADQGGGTVR